MSSDAVMAIEGWGMWSYRFLPTNSAPSAPKTVKSRFLGLARAEMLWTLFVVLLVLWLLGVVTSYTMGGFIHILLVLALVALVFQLISGRRTTI